MTLRVRPGTPSLRRRDFIAALRESFAKARNDESFRLVHYSIQRDHLHLIVEANGHEALGRGMKSVGSRIARAVHRTFSRTGKVMAGRYHVRWLTSPRQVYNALQYTLLNVRKHYRQRMGEAPPVRIDEASSGRWFDGWRTKPPGSIKNARRETADARTWLLRAAWRRYGTIDPASVPALAAK